HRPCPAQGRTDDRRVQGSGDRRDHPGARDQYFHGHRDQRRQRIRRPGAGWQRRPNGDFVARLIVPLVGASLLAKAASNPATMLAGTLLSRAGSLPQGPPSHIYGRPPCRVSQPTCPCCSPNRTFLPVSKRPPRPVSVVSSTCSRTT